MNEKKEEEEEDNNDNIKEEHTHIDRHSHNSIGPKAK